MEYLLISWSALHKSAFQLARKIEKQKIEYDLIVALARGGLTLAHLLSDFLRLPVTSFTIMSYKDLKQESEPEIHYKIGNKLPGKRILLVDDISDTGKTLLKGIKYLEDLGAEKITTVSLFIKPWTKYIPNYYEKSTKAWIIFPFEMRETVESLTRKLYSENKQKEEIKNKLVKIGLPKKFINLYTIQYRHREAAGRGDPVGIASSPPLSLNAVKAGPRNDVLLLICLP